MKLAILPAAFAGLTVLTAAAAHDAPARCSISTAARPMELPALMRQLNAKGYRDVSEIERKSHCYKVKAYTDRGEADVYVQRDTAEILGKGDQ